MIHAMGQQEIKYPGSGELVADVPGVLFEPSSDGFEHTVGKNMDMGIDDLGKSGRNHSTFNVIERGKMPLQHSG